MKCNLRFSALLQDYSDLVKSYFQRKRNYANKILIRVWTCFIKYHVLGFVACRYYLMEIALFTVTFKLWRLIVFAEICVEMEFIFFAIVIVANFLTHF